MWWVYITSAHPAAHGNLALDHKIDRCVYVLFFLKKKKKQAVPIPIKHERKKEDDGEEEWMRRREDMEGSMFTKVGP